MGRAGVAADGQCAAVTTQTVITQYARDTHGQTVVFCHGVAVLNRHRCIIFGCHTNHHRNGICTAFAITDHCGKTVATVVVDVRGIDPAAVRIDGNSAIGWIGAFAEGQRVIIHIGGQ